MATNNNTKVIFRLPKCPSLQAKIQRLVEEDDASAIGWDERSVDLTAADNIPGQLICLYIRDFTYDAASALLDLAKRFGFSLIVHCEDHGDYESEAPNYIRAYDAKHRRDIDCPSCASSVEPLIPLSDVHRYTKQRLLKMYKLPKDLHDGLDKYK